MPGSGKSYLARKILESTVGFDVNHPLHILSTDDYFYQLRGEYDYDVRKLNEAHNWNQSRAFQGMSRGFSPIVIDNTNTEMWEMKPYATMATDYGYLIEILEPYTHWSFNDRELAKRNHHGVPRVKIKEMIDRYEKNIIPEKLLSAYNLVYKLQRPPQMRLYPPPDINTMTLETTTKNVNCVPKSKSVSVLNSGSTDSNTKPIETINLMEFDEDIPKAKSHSISMLETKSSCWNDNPIDEILTNTRDNASTTNILQPYQQSKWKSLL
ncbi:hypothetical protein JTB14_009769 [Gonioctena quinquepunctata]|nr:hypothetical protein JTB14_009769 [Gonioctena quinquepunctata]